MILLFALACAPDDVGSDDTAAGTGSLVGDWVSEGDDISPLFAVDPFNFVTINASFLADASYTVEVVDVDGQTGTLTGTFVTDTSTSPATIVLTQATPYAATASGIWEIAQGELTYEVAQTSGGTGLVPATPETGFGSTSGAGLEAGVNVQIYVAAE